MHGERERAAQQRTVDPERAPQDRGATCRVLRSVLLGLVVALVTVIGSPGEADATTAADASDGERASADHDPMLERPDEPAEKGASDLLLGAEMDSADSDRWWLTSLAAPEARELFSVPEHSTVAVLDTTPDVQRADISADRALDPIKVVEGDHDRHGTAASALAAGDPHGTCTGCDLLPVTVLSTDGQSRASHVAEGIDAAVAAGAEVISLSLGGASGSALLEGAVQDALDDDVVVVAAAGNTGEEEDFYPGAYDGVLSVAAHDESAQRYSWSTFGDWVTVAAPGCSELPLEGSQSFCGTSAATPMVAGIAGMLRSAVPEAEAEEVVAAIAGSDSDLGFVEHGQVDAVTALLDLAERTGTDLESSGDDDGDQAHLLDDATIDELPDAPAEAAVALSQKRFADGEAPGALVTRSDAFPDALSGSTLAGDRPVLYAEGDTVTTETLAELERVLAEDATVHVLGGDQALGESVVDALRDLADDVERLAGGDRIATALAVAEQIDDPDTVFLARADEWADAVAVGGPAAATGTPVLLTDSDELDPRVADYLAAHDIDDVTLLGGTAALGDEVAEAVADLTDREPGRIAGSNRTETSARIAEELVDRSGAGAIIIGGAHPDGWTAGLAAAPLAASGPFPVLLADSDGALCTHTSDELAARWNGDPLQLTVPGSLAQTTTDSVSELSTD